MNLYRLTRGWDRNQGHVTSILYKWVNYGKGWKSRWFVLQDKVLSYYKLHRFDKIVVNKETEKGLGVIGEDSLNLMRKLKSAYVGTDSTNQQKTVGAVNFKVILLQTSYSLLSCTLNNLKYFKE